MLKGIKELTILNTRIRSDKIKDKFSIILTSGFGIIDIFFI
jgi:hypothetical protein